MLANNKTDSEPVLWQRLLTFGNQCYNNQDWQQAEYYYKEAESHLEFLWSLDETNSNLLMAWITALHNLAYLCESTGDSQLGLQYLLIPHYKLLSLTKDLGTSEDLKVIAINALSLTFTPIMAYTKRNPICEECQKFINSLKGSFGEHLEKHSQVVH
ncbi:hypothetical protein WNY51_07530 [Pseudocolwellia sp. AS88]|uniref:hypothetical protein n=1 Tax=Pseudocolwellia sp. AS88 TaxID=3063958 RepID=UPI0026EC2B63|nr:hypothetical protein [Pseudocolwellia sp. AS88]MDO7086650.1 hypothetical protein [Pseudocolwellia sp. AS88]